MLSDELGKPGPQPDGARRTRDAHPAGWEPGVVWDGNAGTVTTAPMSEAPKDWAAILEIWNLDPTQVEIVEPVQLRAWDAQTADGLQRMFYYRAQVRAKRGGANVDELLAEVRRWKPKTPPATDTGYAFLYAIGDTQIGKPDGDGTEGTIARVLSKTDAAVDRLKELRRCKRPIASIYLPQLGDCIEGFNHQGGKLAWRTDGLTLTEQIRIYRRLLLEIARKFAPLAERVIIPVVPGNHDEAVRTGDKMSTRYDDSFAIEAASAVADALALQPDGFGHVSFVFPQKDELTVTLNIEGTIVGFAHGHQTRGKTHDWWAKQAHGLQPIGDATLLMTAHYHHLRIEQTGAKTHIQIPALDGGSTWFRHATGADAPAGAVTLLVGDGAWRDLAVL